MIQSQKDLEQLIQKMGFLPLFRNEIEGFSIEERTPPEFWFSKTHDGPWEWKGPIACKGNCTYGKLFRGKAGFVSMEWYPRLLNHRRGGLDFEERYEAGLAAASDKQVYETLVRHGSMLSKALKRACGYGAHGKKGFDSVLARLQMQGYVIISDFEYSLDQYGRPYGWGIAQYTTPEAQFGEAAASAYSEPPEVSKERIFEHLCRLLPHATEKQVLKMMG